MIEVLRAGRCDLVMDQGRTGRGAIGVPVGGAADPVALAAANALVGNDPAAAGLEVTLAGPDLQFPAGAVVALTGARFVATRSSGAAVTWNQTLIMAPGETLSLAHVSAGRFWRSSGPGAACGRRTDTGFVRARYATVESAAANHARHGCAFACGGGAANRAVC